MVEDLKNVARKMEGFNCSAVGNHIHHGGFCDETGNGSDNMEDNDDNTMDVGLGTGSSDGGYNGTGEITYSFFDDLYTTTTKVTDA